MIKRVKILLVDLWYLMYYIVESYHDYDNIDYELVLNDDDPIINTGVIYISSEENLAFFLSNLKPSGMVIDSLRYLRSNEGNPFDRDTTLFGDTFFIPVLISESWKIYPLFNIQNYINHELSELNIQSPKDLFYHYRSAFSLNTIIKSYYGFDYSENLKYDLTCEYGDVSLSKKYGAGEVDTKPMPMDKK